MKQLRVFFLLLVIVFVLGYLEPVFFPAEKKRESTQSVDVPLTHTSLQYEERAAKGYATFVNQPVTQFTQIFGQPQKKIATVTGSERWFFSSAEMQYLEITVEDEKIMAINVLKSTVETGDFRLGMRLTDVSELMTIFPNFMFDYLGETYTLELMEEDMNYRPLIAFDNGTFAVLSFDYESGKLIGLTYLNKKYLLQFMPYQLTRGEQFKHASTMYLISDADQQAQLEQIVRAMNVLAAEKMQQNYLFSAELEKQAQEIIAFANPNPTAVLSKERAADFQAKEQANAAFMFTNEELQKLVAAASFEARDLSGFFVKPVYDPTFTLLSLYADPLYHTRFLSGSQAEIGVAFSKENMVVLLRNRKPEQTESSESL